ncbi:MAG: hypothetical protein EXX96DRAFT_647989 [Benjaminiella poitrasii]|nr:MAG: hypothetical protein EXX96DRAFT_647989 [Benjaminiella poitrasii]
MEDSANTLSDLLEEWTNAIIEIDLIRVHSLLKQEPELLWTPIPHALDDMDHLTSQLAKTTCLGQSFHPLGAIQFVCLFHRNDSREAKKIKLLTYLIKQSSVHDLNTRSWGECNNPTLHLACFLDDLPMIRLLTEKGVSLAVVNDLNYEPKDVTTSQKILDYLSLCQQEKANLKTTVRPNYSTPDRFQLLRNLAEESSTSATTSTIPLLDHTGKSKKLLDITLDRQKSDGRYFRKGRVKETQQKVLLTEEVVELGKQKRQLEVAQLVKKSAVKNNPLFQKLEKKKSFHVSPPPTPDIDPSIKLPPEPMIIKEDASSTAEASLKKVIEEDSAVATFTETQTSPSNSSFEETTTMELPSREHDDELSQIAYMPLSDDYTEEIHTQSSKQNDATSTVTNNWQQIDVAPNDFYINIKDMEDFNNNNQLEKPLAPPQQQNNHPIKEIDKDIDDDDQDEGDEEEIASTIQFATRLASPVYKSVVILNNNEDMNRKQPSQHILSNQRNTQLSNDSGVELEQKNNGSVLESPSFSPTRPPRSSLRQKNMYTSMEDPEKSKEIKRMSGSQKASWTMSMSSWAAILDREFNLEEIDPEKKRNEDYILSSSSASSLLSSRSSLSKVLDEDVVEEKEEKEHDSSDPSFAEQPSKGMGRSGFPALFFDDVTHDMSVLSLASILKINNWQEQQNNTISHHAAVTTPPQIGDISALCASNSMIRRKPISFYISSETNLRSRSESQKQQIESEHHSKLDQAKSVPPTLSHNPARPTAKTTTYLPSFKMRATSAFTSRGKLYLHVNGVQDILLPIPKERTYVRCVVSDGRFEYMSRYEILSQNIQFDYECVIDTHPDMIITISLHVRPDYVMKKSYHYYKNSHNVIPFFLARFLSFSSNNEKKKKTKKTKEERLSVYVNKEDGAIGQARFALAHMIPACTEIAYPTGFHCFNAWYSKTVRRQTKKLKKKRMNDAEHDVLKVVGNFDVEMLYLPISNDQQSTADLPRSLRECNEFIMQQFYSPPVEN